MPGRVYKSFSTQLSKKISSYEVLAWARKHFTAAVLLNSNDNKHDKYASYRQIIAIGASEIFTGSDDVFEGLKAFTSRHNDWFFGFFSYELKNQLEQLDSKNPDYINMPAVYFFRPVIIMILEQSVWHIGCLPGYGALSSPEHLVSDLLLEKSLETPIPESLQIKARVKKNRYLSQVSAIKEHIQAGDIYEMNYCVEFFAQDAVVDPLTIYRSLNHASPTPFSCFFMLHDKYLMCASPERFLKKEGDRIISQPIKGTSARSADPKKDALLKQGLYNDSKERSENVMIVDLVRNDLSRTAKKGSVQVDELFGIYSFRQVHQMISTVISKLHPGCHFLDAIKYAFPMGSMTGAPKIRAMQLIDHYEDTLRGLYSGAVGYISPEKNFDFNVVIRSILYNATNQYLSYMAGSAITIGSVPEKEYEECMLKAKAMEKAIRDVNSAGSKLNNQKKLYQSRVI